MEAGDEASNAGDVGEAHQAVESEWAVRGRVRRTGWSAGAHAFVVGWNLGAARSRSKPTPKSRPLRSSTAVTKLALQPSPLTFVEMTSAKPNDALEVELPTARIRVRPGFDASTLIRLLDVLERR